MTAPDPEPSPEEQAALEQEAGEYCRYLVCLAALRYDLDNGGDSNDHPTPFFCSGFLMIVGRRWYFVTAGHILRDMEEQVRKKRAQYRDFVLADSFGRQTPHKDPIPFDFAGAQKIFRYDQEEGLDFAFVALRPMYREFLAANNAIAITEADCHRWKFTHFAKHFMLGFQEEAVEKRVVVGKHNLVVSGRPYPVFTHIRKLHVPPDRKVKTKNPRFVGQIEPHHAVGNLKGMSGGPIFGVTPGFRKHGIVAIQSGWLPKRRITFACPIGVFTRFARRLLM